MPSGGPVCPRCGVNDGHTKQCLAGELPPTPWPPLVTPPAPPPASLATELAALPLKFIDDFTTDEWHALTPMELHLIRTIERINQIARNSLGGLKPRNSKGEPHATALERIVDASATVFEGPKKAKAPTRLRPDLTEDDVERDAGGEITAVRAEGLVYDPDKDPRNAKSPTETP